MLICGQEDDELPDGFVAKDPGVAIGDPCDENSVQGARDLIARTQGQAPDVDGVVHLEEGDVGSIVSVSITGAYCYELEAEILEVTRA